MSPKLAKYFSWLTYDCDKFCPHVIYLYVKVLLHKIVHIMFLFMIEFILIKV